MLPFRVEYKGLVLTYKTPYACYRVRWSEGPSLTLRFCTSQDLLPIPPVKEARPMGTRERTFLVVPLCHPPPHFGTLSLGEAHKNRTVKMTLFS